MTTAVSTTTVLGLLGAIVVIVTMIWMAWRFWRRRSKEIDNLTRVTLGCLGLVVFLVLLWIGWKFQPWMPTGRAVHISSERLGEYDFQVWQRKTDIATEPFATGLFVRKQGGQWKAYLLDWQDIYRSTIVLRERGTSVEVLQDGTRLGVFDESQQIFKRDSNDGSYPGDVLDSEPPANWWLKAVGKNK